MVIQNNIPGLNSKRLYNKNSSKLAKSLEKLSSGYSINRSADDAAGLAVSEKMRSQIFGMQQSVKNCQDGISLIQTFEGALGETVAIIKRMKTLADQSANGTYDDNVDRNAVEIEYLHLCDEVNQIAETDFNGIVMLSGKNSVKAEDLNSTDGVGLPGLTRDISKAITIGKAESILKSEFDIQIKQIYNDTNAADLTASVQIHITEDQIRNDPKIMTLMRQCRDQVNNDNHGLGLGYEIGANIPLDTVLSRNLIAWFGTAAASNGDDKDIKGKPQVGDWAIMLEDSAFTDDSYWDFTISKIIPFTIERIDWVDHIPDKFGNFNYSTSNATAIKVFDIIIHSSENKIQGTLGFDLTMNVFDDEFDDENTDKTGDFKISIPNAYGNATAKLTYTDNLIFQTGARTKDSVNFSFSYSTNGIGGLKADLDCTAKGLGLDVLSLSEQESANYAIDRLDHALNKVSMIRATFGAAQNRLEHKIDNLNNTTENLTAAESQIRDTNMAQEMMNFTKQQILTQASQSMLAQATSLPQQVLSLISS